MIPQLRARQADDSEWSKAGLHYQGMERSELGETLESPQPLIAPVNSTLRARFATVASCAGTGRKDTRGKDRALVWRRANLEEQIREGSAKSISNDGWGNGDAAGTAGAEECGLSPLQRLRRTGQTVVRQILRSRLAESPNDKRLLRRLGHHTTNDEELDEALELFRQTAKNSTNDQAWVLLARSEVRAWARDPITGHERLRSAVDAYRRSIDLMVPGFVQAWELPLRLFELAEVYEAYGSFEGALSIFMRIASSMPFSRGFEIVLFRCAVVMRYIASLEGVQPEMLLVSAREHLDLAMQGQTNRNGAPNESTSLLYADVCYAEGSVAANKLASISYQHIFDDRKRRGDLQALGFRNWDDWLSSPGTRVQLAREWARRGEPALAVLNFQQAELAFERAALSEGKISALREGRKLYGLGYSELMDTAEAFASFQRFEGAREAAVLAAELEPNNPEVTGMMRAFLGDTECRQKDMHLQVVLHIQSKWRTRVWHGEYLASLKRRLRQVLEKRLVNDRLDMETRDHLSYFCREKHRPVFIYEDQCANAIQKMGKAGLFRLRWFAAKRAAYRKQLASALKLYQNNPWMESTREVVVSRARSRYTPAEHKIVSVAALVAKQDVAVLPLQRAIRSMLARKLFRRMLRDRSKYLRKKREQAIIRLQASARRYLAYRDRARRARHVIIREKAAIHIQRVYRAWALQWLYAVQRAARAHAIAIAKAKHALALKLQAIWKMKMERREAHRLWRAVVNVQRVARGRQGKRRASRKRNELICRIQRQWRRRRDRNRTLDVLLKMRFGREKRAAQARDIERRFRQMEERQKLGGSGAEVAATPAGERRARRRNDALLARTKIRSKTAARAVTRFTPPPTSIQSAAFLFRVQSRNAPADDWSPTLSQEKNMGETVTLEKIPSTVTAVGRSAKIQHEQAAPCQPELTSVKQHISKQGFQMNKTSKSNTTRMNQRTNADTLAWARGLGGRLGSPLGSPHLAPGDWVGGASAAEASLVASLTNSTRAMLQPSPERDELGQRPPGSGLFPPYVKPGGEGSPVVYEMVRDAADDENEQRRLLPRGGGLAAKTQHGWNGLTLYRHFGVCTRSAPFQQALQLRTIAFSPPDSDQQPTPSHAREQPGSASGFHEDNTTAGDDCARMTVMDEADHSSISSPAFVRVEMPDRPSRSPEIVKFSQAATCNGRAGDSDGSHTATNKLIGRGSSWGKRERTLSAPRPKQLDVFGGNQRSRLYDQFREQDSYINAALPLAFPLPPQPSKEFNSGDMVMVAGLLAHPESPLKRLLLHRAHIDTDAGRQALLRCVQLNKLECLALGACAGLDRNYCSRQGAVSTREGARAVWWDTLGDTIRTSGFLLEDLVVEGLETGGDILGRAMGIVLSDFFVRTAGKLSSLCLVRCRISDEGASAIARGAIRSPTLTHLDLSANVISDVGAEALARALSGHVDAVTEQDLEIGGMSARPRASREHLKSLDLGQNRITDAGGLALVAALPKCTLLQRLDLSYNCISEEGGRGFLNLIEGDNGNAGCSAPLEIRTEGNLFDDSLCRLIEAAAMDAKKTTRSRAAQLPQVPESDGFTNHNFFLGDKNVVKEEDTAASVACGSEPPPQGGLPSSFTPRRSRALSSHGSKSGRLSIVSHIALPSTRKRDHGFMACGTRGREEEIRSVLLSKIERAKRKNHNKDVTRLYTLLKSTSDAP